MKMEVLKIMTFRLGEIEILSGTDVILEKVWIPEFSTIEKELENRMSSVKNYLENISHGNYYFFLKEQGSIFLVEKNKALINLKFSHEKKVEDRRK